MYRKTMGCDFYIIKTVYMDYRINGSNDILTKEISKNIERGYFSETDFDSDDDADVFIEKSLKKHTKPDKILFADGQWTKPGYKKNYENKIDNDIELIKLYKTTIAEER